MKLDIVDFHSHILPRADHGSNSLDTSLKQLRFASLAGVKRIVATPHFYPHRHTLRAFLDRREESYYKLKSHLTEDMPKIRLGAEVLICDNIERFLGLEKLCLSGTNVLLLELPFNDFNDNFCTSVENLISKGFDVVLAHADRYPPENIERLVELGATIQINAISVATFFRNKQIYNWAERGLITALGSDIHNVDPTAYKKFEKAQIKLSDYIHEIKAKSDAIWEQSKSYRQIRDFLHS